MKRLLILLFIICALNSWTQETSEIELGPSSFGLHLAFGPNYRQFNSSGETLLIEQRNLDERLGSVFRIGLNTDYALSEKWIFQFNFLYADRNYRTNITPFTYTDPSIISPEKGYGSFHFVYFDMPLRMRYNITKGQKINCFVAAGVSPSFILFSSRKTHTYANNNWTVEKKTQTIGNDILNFFGEIELGCDFQLSKQTLLRASLNGQHALKGTNANLSTKEYLRGAEFGVGLYFKPKLKVKP